MENCLSIRPDPNYYTVDRKKLLDFKPLHKRLSGNFLDYDYPLSKYYKEAHTFIIKNFYSLFNHVSNEFTPNLVVKFDSMSSFNGTVKNVIQLGTQLLAIDGFSQQMKVDTMFAVMLHEMWHKRFTNRDIAKAYTTPTIPLKEYYDSKDIEKVFTKLLPDKVTADIFNILEDYRIEKLGLRDFPGYVFYFDVHREFCIELHKGKKINQTMLPQLAMEYLMFKILLPELREAYMGFIDDTYKGLKNPKYNKKNILELIKKFDDYIHRNARMVYSDDVRDVIKASQELAAMIPKGMKDEVNKDIDALGKGFTGTGEKYFMDSDKKEEEGYKGTKKEVEKTIEGEIDKAEGTRSGNRSGGDSEDTDRSREEKLEFGSAASGVFDSVVIYNPKCKNVDKSIYQEALKMSGNIARNLGFLSAKLNQLNQEYELSEGELDEDELYSISFSNNLFFEEEPKPGFEFDFGILIDESGSMRAGGGVKIRNATIAALSCVLSMNQSQHVNLFVYGHSQGRHGKFINGQFEMYEYINTKRKISDWKNVFAASANGGNADGYAIAKLGEIMIKDSKAKNKILVVISDGMPAAYNYEGVLAEQHIKGVVTLLEKSGIEVIQICIDNIARSSFMFKNFIPYDSMGNFIKKFREILQKRLTQFTENL